MTIYGRDARIGPRSFKHLFSGTYRNPEANRLSGIYELSLRRANEAGSPGSTLLSSRICSHLVHSHIFVRLLCMHACPLCGVSVMEY